MGADFRIYSPSDVYAKIGCCNFWKFTRRRTSFIYTRTLAVFAISIRSSCYKHLLWMLIVLALNAYSFGTECL